MTCCRARRARLEGARELTLRPHAFTAPALPRRASQRHGPGTRRGATGSTRLLEVAPWLPTGRSPCRSAACGDCACANSLVARRLMRAQVARSLPESARALPKLARRRSHLARFEEPPPRTTATPLQERLTPADFLVAPRPIEIAPRLAAPTSPPKRLAPPAPPASPPCSRQLTPQQKSRMPQLRRNRSPRDRSRRAGELESSSGGIRIVELGQQGLDPPYGRAVCVGWRLGVAWPVPSPEWHRCNSAGAMAGGERGLRRAEGERAREGVRCVRGRRREGREQPGHVRGSQRDVALARHRRARPLQPLAPQLPDHGTDPTPGRPPLARRRQRRNGCAASDSILDATAFAGGPMPLW